LLPLGGEAVVKPVDEFLLEKSGGRFAPKREQAPSPQVRCLTLKEAGEQRGDGGFDPQDAVAELHRLQA
jgi:hypothetical protein